MGSITDLTDLDGDSVSSYTYDPYGNAVDAPPASPDPIWEANPFRYTGQATDPDTGDVYLRHRQYDPVTGRFTATDPITAGVGEPWYDLYTYTQGRPTTHVDPDGRASLKYQLPWKRHKTGDISNTSVSKGIVEGVENLLRSRRPSGTSALG